MMACLEPLSQYDATLVSTGRSLIPTTYAPDSPLVAAPITNSPEHRTWFATSEGRNKPGWVATNTGAVLRFSLRFGKHPSVSIIFFRSYEGLGAVEVGINGRTFRIDPTWSRRVSLTETWFVQAGAFAGRRLQQETSDSTALRALGVMPWTNQTLTVKFLGPSGKFKLVAVNSC